MRKTRFPSAETLYVVKQKCTTANVVIYSDISLFYYQKFFLLSLCKYTFLLIIITKTSNLIGGKVVHFCLNTYIADILRNEKDQNYTIAKKAFRSLAQKGVEYEDDEIWQYTSIISNPKIDKIKGYVIFTVLDDIWRCLLDFTKGYRKYELVTAMQFKSVYSMRMYELMSGQKRPLEFTFEDLKQRFGVKDKYKLVGHFKTRVLDIAKKELDENSPYSFNYIEVKRGRKVVGFKFFPTFNPDKKDSELYATELRSKVSTSAQISHEAYDYFRYSFEFKADEISKNKITIIEGEKKIPGFISFLSSLVGPSRTAKNRIGYVINAIKKKTVESK